MRSDLRGGTRRGGGPCRRGPHGTTEEGYNNVPPAPAPAELYAVRKNELSGDRSSVFFKAHFKGKIPKLTCRKAKLPY